MNDIERVISRLESQRASIDKALAALRDLDAAKPAAAAGAVAAPKPGEKPKVKRKKSRLSPEGRQRIIDAAKKRWAEKNAADAAKGAKSAAKKK